MHPRLASKADPPKINALTLNSAPPATTSLIAFQLFDQKSQVIHESFCFPARPVASCLRRREGRFAPKQSGVRLFFFISVRLPPCPTACGLKFEATPAGLRRVDFDEFVLIGASAPVTLSSRLGTLNLSSAFTKSSTSASIALRHFIPLCSFAVVARVPARAPVAAHTCSTI